MFMAMIEYWHETGDTTYNNEVSVGMQWQAGDGDYMPSNWSSYLVSKVAIQGYLRASGLTCSMLLGKRRSNVLGSGRHDCS